MVTTQILEAWRLDLDEPILLSYTRHKTMKIIIKILITILLGSLLVIDIIFILINSVVQVKMAIFETSNFGDFGVFVGTWGQPTMTFVQELYL